MQAVLLATTCHRRLQLQWLVDSKICYQKTSYCCSLLLYSRPAGECFVAIVSNADSVKAGHTAECIILGIKDRFEEEVIYEYEKLSLEAGDQLRGCVVDFMCNVQRRVAPAGQSNTEESSSEPVGSRMPVLGDQVPLADREVISEPLFTGLKVRQFSP